MALDSAYEESASAKGRMPSKRTLRSPYIRLSHLVLAFLVAARFADAIVPLPRYQFARDRPRAIRDLTAISASTGANFLHPRLILAYAAATCDCVVGCEFFWSSRIVLV